jgi:transposase InsO family protein
VLPVREGASTEGAVANHLRTELVLEALNMAIWQRRPASVIHHSDQGCQYTSLAFGKRCKQLGVRPSMGSVGDCYDNAMAESFFATLECELIDRTSVQTHAEARLAIFRIHRGLVQSPSPSQKPRPEITHQFREELSTGRLNPKQSTVH